MFTLSLRPQAHITLKPTLQQQKKCENCTETIIDGVFAVQYDVERESNTGELQVPHVDWNKFTRPADRRCWITLEAPVSSPGLRRTLRPFFCAVQPFASSQKHRVRH